MDASAFFQRPPITVEDSSTFQIPEHLAWAQPRLKKGALVSFTGEMDQIFRGMVLRTATEATVVYITPFVCDPLDPDFGSAELIRVVDIFEINGELAPDEVRRRCEFEQAERKANPEWRIF